MTEIRLGTTGEAIAQHIVDKNKDYVDIDVIALVPGVFINSTDGREVEITEDDVRAIHDKYNDRVMAEKAKLKKRIALFTTKDEEIEGAPVHKDHDLSQDKMVGRVIGFMSLVEEDNILQLRARLRVKTRRFVEESSLYKEVSIAFNPESHFVTEISFVPYGAVGVAERITYKATKPEKVPNITLKKDIRNDIACAYIELKKQYDNLKLKLDVRKITLKLKSSGKLPPIAANRLACDFERFSSQHDRDIAFKMVRDMLPTLSTRTVHSQNKNAVNFEEVLKMSTEEQKNTANVFAQAFKKVKGIAENAVELAKKKEKKEDEMCHYSRMSKEDGERLSALAHGGKMPEFDELLSKFTSDKEKDEEEDEEKTSEMKKMSARLETMETALKNVETSIVTFAKATEQTEEMSKTFAELKKILEEGK